MLTLFFLKHTYNLFLNQKLFTGGLFKFYSTKKIPFQKRWVFTLNNHTDSDISLLKNNDPEKLLKHPNDFHENTVFQYLCFSQEIAPKTGTKHLQGFFILHQKQRPNFFKNFLLSKPFVPQAAAGNNESNLIYCAKSGQQFFIQAGDRPPLNTDLLKDYLKKRNLLESPDVLALFPEIIKDKDEIQNTGSSMQNYLSKEKSLHGNNFPNFMKNG